MGDAVYDIIQNKTKSMVLRYVIFLIITIVLIEQIYTYTKLIFNYNKSFDTGNLLRKVCDTNYTEYETERFHVSNDIVKMKIDNDDSNIKYDVVFFIFSIIVTMVINYFFLYIFAETAFDNLLSVVFGLLTPLTGGFTALAMPLLQTIGNDMKDFFANNSIFVIIMTAIKCICMLYLMFIIPISIIVKLATNIDISILVKTTPDSSFTSSNTDLTFDYKNLFGHFSILLIIWFFQFNKLFISRFTYNIFFVLFVLFYIIIMQITDLYMQQKDYTVFKNTNNDELKYLEFAYKYKTKSDVSTYGIITLIYNILGLNDIRLKSQDDYMKASDLKNFNKYLNKIDEKIPVTINKFNTLLSIWLLMIVGVIIVYFLLYLKPNGAELYHVFDAGTKDRDILYYIVLVPLLFIFITMFIIVMTREYNTFINKNILYIPTHLYKQKIQDINNVFNKLLENDKATVSNNSVCQNTANAIHMVLYTNLFKECDKTKLFVPELNYVSACTPNHYFSYNDAQEYQIDQYISNLFYEDSKCTSVDNELILGIMKGMIPNYESALTDSDLDVLKRSIKNQLKFGIVNVLNKKTYDGGKGLEISNNYANNNNISSPEVLDNPNVAENALNKDTLDLIDLVAEEYILYTRITYVKIISTIQALCKCNKIDNFTNQGYQVLIDKIDVTITNDTNGVYSMNIKKDFVTNYINIMKEMFKNINTMMTANVKIDKNNYKLTKYIINNFNSYRTNDSEKHRKSTFHEIPMATIDNFGVEKYKDIEEIRTIIRNLYKTAENIHAIFSPPKTSVGTINYEIVKTKIVELDNRIDSLRQARKQYIDSYKMNLYKNADYIKQLTYDYKMQYIDDNIKLHDDISKTIKNSNIYKNYDLVINSEEFKMKAELMQSRTTFEDFDFDAYKKRFEEYDTLYSNQYDVMYMLVNEFIKANIGNNPLLDELTTNYALLKAQETSSMIYFIVFIYIVLVILANFIE